MIARIWHGLALHERADDYVEHLQAAVLPGLSRIDGYKGAYVLSRDLPGGVEFTVQTFWDSMDAIRKFAGKDLTRAVVAPAAKPLFRSFDSTVTHREVVLSVKQ